MAADEDKHNNRHDTEQLSSTTVDDSLDEYGVWVKSGPEEVSDEETGEPETIYDLQQDDAPGSEDIESTPAADASETQGWDESGDTSSAMSDYPESMDLSDEEEALLADLEDTDSNIDVPDSSPESGQETEQGTPDEGSELSLPDDLDLSGDLELPDDLDLSDDEEPDLESREGESPEEESFSMDLPGEEASDLEIPTDTGKTQGQGEPEGFSQTEGFENEDDLDMFFENGESEEEESESDIQFEYAESEDAVPDLELGDDDDPSQPEDTEPVNHGEEADTASITPGTGDFAGGQHTGDSDSNSDFGQENPPVTEISLEEVGNEDFDDVGAVAGEMAEPLPEEPISKEQDQSHRAASGEYSREAFQLIQNELASIKSELAGLKDELQDLRGAQGPTSPPSAAEPSPSSDASSEREEAPQEAVDIEGNENPFEDTDEALQGGEGGFFEEDEDETIALTGDELDNILNTAEFTEEQGQPTNFEDADLDLDLSSLEGSDTLSEDDALDNLENLDKADSLSDSENLEETESEEHTASEGDTQFGLSDEEIEDNIVELDTDDENYAFDAPDAGTEVEEALSGDTAEAQETGVQGDSAEQQAVDETDESEPFGGSPEDVDALANMDIDTELADIDELDDSVDAEPSPVDLQETDDQNEEPEYDTEPESGLGFSEDSVEDSLEQQPTEAETEAPTASDNTPVAGEPETGEVSEELSEELPEGLKEEIRSVLSYMDQLLESLPEEKIREFANSEHFEVYKRLFEELELEP